MTENAVTLETEIKTIPRIKLDEYLIVQKVDGEQSRVIRFTKNQKVLIEKLSFSAESAVGHPYGVFEIIGGKCYPLSADNLKEEDEMEDETKEERTVIAPSALKLEPDQKRQKLAMEDVLEMKKQGTSANELVAKLVEGSASFSTRTAFSQNKYIRRKTKKHSDRVLIMKPNIRLLARAYYLKDADRIAMMRVDHLGLILQYSGVHHGRNAIVVEQTSGIVTAAVLERLAGKGSCVHIHRGAIAQSIPSVQAMNFDDKTMATFLPVRIKCLIAGEQLPYDNFRKDNGPKEYTEERVLTEEEEKALARRADRLEREKKGLELIEKGADTLIIASRTIDPVNVLETLYPKMAPASSIVIYSPHMNLLTEAYEWLSRNNSVNIMLSNQMCRIHQVLPDRTHPLMAQHIAGGYVLTAIKVIPPESH